MGRPNDASRTARGVLPSPSSPSPEFISGSPSDGGGKTHILRTLSVIERGIVLIFIPLLTLSADVMQKFDAANTTWGNVGVYHLDELYDANRSAFDSLLRRCLTIKCKTTSTLFIFLSPQFLVHHRNTLDIFLICARERTLRLIAIDEAHM